LAEKLLIGGNAGKLSSASGGRRLTAIRQRAITANLSQSFSNEPISYLILLHSLVAKIYLTGIPKQMCAEKFEDLYYQYIDWDDEYWQGPPGSGGYLESDDERDYN
jgi:hypothetical protein